MEINKILTADLLDIVFDGRNKDYGAYELRATYPERVKKSMIISFSVLAVVITSSVIASNSKEKIDSNLYQQKELVFSQVPPEEIKPPEIIKPKLPEQEIKTVQYITPVIADEVQEPPPTQSEIETAIIGDEKKEGRDYDGTQPGPINEGTDKGIIDQPKPETENILTTVEVQAKFNGDWIKFLTKNLNPQVPVDNGAPAGRYTVVIRFVVDKEGNVSDIVPQTNIGYGMEQEAVRVLKKATKWEPAIQNGYKVKAYRTQPVTFEVLPEE